MSDEERKAIKILKINPEIIADLDEEMFEKMCEFKEESIKELKYWASQTALNLIDKQSKEIEEYKKQLDLDNECEIALNNRIMDLEKEIEELKENNKNLEDELNKYIVKLSDEQYRRLVDIIRDEINKLWKDKIKAKIEELDYNDIGNFERRCKQEVLQSLLEKE